MPKLLYETRWLSVYEGFQATPYIACLNSVMLVPLLPNGEVILTHEPTAYSEGELKLFLPSGGIEPGEDTLAAAHRELQEEIGLAAARLELLAQVQPWVKYLSADLTVYLARDLTPSRRQGDEPYPILQETVPLASFEALIASGRLRDSSVIAALFLARRKLAGAG